MLTNDAVDAVVESVNDGGDLIVFSHLRWTWVWQRPQQIISRLAPRFDRTIFVEEPEVVPDATEPVLRFERCGLVVRAWLEVPGPAGHCGFYDSRADTYPRMLEEYLLFRGRTTVWLYTPLALDHARNLRPQTMVFDVMDDLSAFAHANPMLPALHRSTLATADVVFTGGRSLQRAVSMHRTHATCFPSGVDLAHYSRSVAMRSASRSRPVAGYVGVVDERVNLGLLRDMAHDLPDWDIHVVGPVAKIDPASLPVAPNILYTGARSYGELPLVMAGFDVALMPFELNEATRSISPTKSLEYLAAGLPVVSTPVPDVVSELSEVVDIEDDAAGFAVSVPASDRGSFDRASQRHGSAAPMEPVGCHREPDVR